MSMGFRKFCEIFIYRSKGLKTGHRFLHSTFDGQVKTVVIHFNFACGCCRRVLSDSFLLLPFFSVGVAVFSAAVVALDLAVAVIPQMNAHKERAAEESLISESP